MKRKKAATSTDGSSFRPRLKITRTARKTRNGSYDTGAAAATMPQPRSDDDAVLDRLQCETFEYFLKEVNPLNGLIADKTRDGWPASIAARSSW